MESEGLAELLKQYSTLTRKLRDTEEKLDKIHESARIEGVYTFTFSNKAIWSGIHEKATELTCVIKQLNQTLDRIQTKKETGKP